MRAGRNRPGLSTDFIDSASDEAILRIGCSASGEPKLAFRLYDSEGKLVSATEGFASFPEGVTIVAECGDVLLNVPASPESHISYRLFNRQGRLLTCSDGSRTQVYAFLRMEKGKI
jgi:hypothetical protein